MIDEPCLPKSPGQNVDRAIGIFALGGPPLGDDDPSDEPEHGAGPDEQPDTTPSHASDHSDSHYTPSGSPPPSST
jgi:hypothetical protein